MLDGAGASTFLDLIDDRNQDKFYKKIQKNLQNFLKTKLTKNQK